MKENPMVKGAIDKVEEAIGNLDENETVNQVKKKIADAVEDLQNTETGKKVTEFLKDKGVDANEVIENVTEKVQSSGLLGKLKGLFGKK